MSQFDKTLSCIEHCWQISYSKGSPHSRLAHLKLFLHSFPQNSGLAEGCATKLVGWEDHRISWREVNRKQLQNLGGNDGNKKLSKNAPKPRQIYHGHPAVSKRCLIWASRDLGKGLRVPSASAWNFVSLCVILCDFYLKIWQGFMSPILVLAYTFSSENKSYRGHLTWFSQATVRICLWIHAGGCGPHSFARRKPHPQGKLLATDGRLFFHLFSPHWEQNNPICKTNNLFSKVTWKKKRLQRCKHKRISYPCKNTHIS